jgi:hypothetical protein
MTMRTLKHLVILSLVAFVAVFVAAPGALAKKALTEDEMDLITAAGQPKIIQTGTGDITFTDSPVNTLSLGTDAQRTLTALVLNNVAGEVQLANALNITVVGFQNGILSQDNTITQSWGATKDWTASSVAGVSATAASSAAASASSAATCSKCGINRAGNAAASTAAAAAASTSPGVLKVLTKYADQIVETVSGDVFVEQNGNQTLSLDSGSQQQMAALVVNNVVGLSQVANAVNVLANQTLMNVGGTTLNAAFFANGQSQANTITQYRGTPFSRPAAP